MAAPVPMFVRCAVVVGVDQCGDAGCPAIDRNLAPRCCHQPQLAGRPHDIPNVPAGIVCPLEQNLVQPDERLEERQRAPGVFRQQLACDLFQPHCEFSTEGRGPVVGMYRVSCADGPAPWRRVPPAPRVRRLPAAVRGAPELLGDPGPGRAEPSPGSRRPAESQRLQACRRWSCTALLGIANPNAQAQGRVVVCGGRQRRA